MVDDVAFLSAMRADLSNDAPRLVYADWLQERGDVRGEYLRLQVQLVRTWTYADQKPEFYARLEELAALIDPDWLAAVRRCTTPAPPIDVALAIPLLANQSKVTVRLHPRPGDAAIDESKLGGLFLWPQDERWPVCPEHGTPLLTAFQLRKEDVPEVGFPSGCDLFQLLWCPQIDHSTIATSCTPLPMAFWRERATVAKPRGSAPDVPVAPGSYAYSRFRPCRVHPERIVEYPSPLAMLYDQYLFADIKQARPLDDAADALAEMPHHGAQIPDSADSLYQHWLSTAPGTKVGGYPNLCQGPCTPNCACGETMELLLTYTNWEFNGVSWGRFIPIEDRRHLWGPLMEGTGIWEPADCRVGDGGSIYVYICRHCPGWPLRANMDSC